MRNVIMLLALSVAGSGLATKALADDPQGVLLLMPVKEVFVPNGFDDNDEIQLVVDGYLPDTCHRVAFTQTEIDRPAKKVIVRQWARRFPGVCLQIVLPFSAEARLGQLSPGDYEVHAHGVQTERLSVGFGVRPGPDSHLYAPVETARVETKADGKLFGIVEGRFTNTCMKWTETQVINSGKTVEVLPIVEMVDRDDCEAREVPFSWTVELPAPTTEGRRLMHVRSLNGKAVNVVF